jgi:hypothetical protein
MSAASSLIYNPVRVVIVFILSGAAFLSSGYPAKAADLSGYWSGRWESCTSGHQGSLHADFCKIDDTHYQVRFHGRFFMVVPFRYSVTLEVTGHDQDKVFLAGDSYLGRFFGTFYYQAEASECEFTAMYSSCRDHGKFTLHRSGH